MKMDQYHGERQTLTQYTNMEKIYAILITMVKITDDPNMLELLNMLRVELDKIK